MINNGKNNISRGGGYKVILLRNGRRGLESYVAVFYRVGLGSDKWQNWRYVTDELPP